MANISDIAIGQLVRVISVSKPGLSFLVGQEVMVKNKEGGNLLCATGSGDNPLRYEHTGRVCLSARQVELV